MTQDLGTEDGIVEADESLEEPAAEDEEEERSGRRSVIWPLIALIILILLLFWCLWGYWGSRKGAVVGIKKSVTAVTTGQYGVTEPPATDFEVDEGPVVPDVIGMQRGAAIAAIQAAGYVASVTDVYGTSHPANSVFQQRPSGGSRLDEGGTVGMLVQQRAKPTVTVPDLYGLTQAEAERRIRALGLDVTLSYAPTTGTRKAGRTYSQWPRAGDRVPADGDVQIQITIEP